MLQPAHALQQPTVAVLLVPFIPFIFLFIFLVYVFAYVCEECACQDPNVEVRGQIGRVGFLLLPSSGWGLNSNCQAWPQVSLPAEPSSGLGSLCF